MKKFERRKRRSIFWCRR